MQKQRSVPYVGVFVPTLRGKNENSFDAPLHFFQKLVDLLLVIGQRISRFNNHVSNKHSAQEHESQQGKHHFRSISAKNSEIPKDTAADKPNHTKYFI